jgi:integrase
MAKRTNKGGFTLHRDGYVRWYRGKTRFVAGRSVDPARLDEIWLAKRKAIDAGESAGRVPTGPIRLRDLATAYLASVDAAVAAGRLAVRSQMNNVRAANRFGEFVGGDRFASEIGPTDFAAFARSLKGLAASGVRPIIARVRAMFHWAVKMELLPRVRFGAEFVAPGAQDIRDARIVRRRGFSPAEVAAIIDAAPPTLAVAVAVAICGGMNQSEVASIERSQIDAAGVVDFRRRKRGRIRRVVPLPAQVLQMLSQYRRPEPREPGNADRLLLNECGRPLTRNGKAGWVDTAGQAFRLTCVRIGVTNGRDGRGFGGLRASFATLAPAGGYREEIEIVMGHAHGSMLLDHYLEDVGLDRLRYVVGHVWGQVAQNLRREFVGPVPVEFRT